MSIHFVEPGAAKADALIVGVFAGKQLGEQAAKLDKDSGGIVSRALAASPRFTGAAEQVLEILSPAGIKANRILLIGLGEADAALAYEAWGGLGARRLLDAGDKDGIFLLDLPKGAKQKAGDAMAHAALGARLGSYRFDKYHTKKKPEEKARKLGLTFMGKGAGDAKKAYGPLEKLADAIHFTRDIVTEPANVIHPESLAAECKKLSKLGLKVTVLGEAQMKKLGMGALLGVGQGSDKESQLVVMEWEGGRKGDKPLAFIGKGVCFDTGGISIKPSAGMEDMKWDMGGAAAVIGLMHALAGRKAKVNAVGVVGLVENMPSGNAQRPGDVVTSMSGQTIEVLNTDAEGRLVLCDAMWYAQERFKPKAMVDLATLTGAIIVSLGHDHAGLFANDDKLANAVLSAGQKTGESCWRMPVAPVGQSYDKMLKSQIADMGNIQAGHGRVAGSIVAAQFLQRFVKDKTPWVHLDIAGTAWTNAEKPTNPKGATAFGVRLLDAMIRDHYEA